MNNTKYLYSSSDEMFGSDECDSKEEAIEKAKFELELEKGDRIYIGKKVELNKEWLTRNISIIDKENIEEVMYENVGDVAEDWLKDLDEEKLNKILIDYLYQHHKPHFCLVEDIEEATIN